MLYLALAFCSGDSEAAPETNWNFLETIPSPSSTRRALDSFPKYVTSPICLFRFSTYCFKVKNCYTTHTVHNTGKDSFIKVSYQSIHKVLFPHSTSDLFSSLLFGNPSYSAAWETHTGFSAQYRWVRKKQLTFQFHFEK